MKFGLTNSTIDSIQAVLLAHSAVEKAILYGSRAKGTSKANSDIDLTLLGDSLTLSEQLRIDAELDDLLLPYKIDLSIQHAIENPELIHHINRVGVVFYSKP
jgi:predicted nucleotidyltransferase